MPLIRRRRQYRKRAGKARSKPSYRRAPIRSGMRRVGRALAIRRPTSNFSRIHEEFDINVTANTTTAFVAQISQLLRAQQLAPYFQEYKITSVKFNFKPKWDTYPAGNPSQLPYFLYTNDSASSVPNTIAYQDYIVMGCKPVRFDDKSLVRYMPPCVIMNSTLSSPTVLPAIIRKSPWLPTSSSNGGAFSLNDVVHHGAKFLITGITPADTSNYVVTVSVNVLFRKPLVQVVPPV